MKKQILSGVACVLLLGSILHAQSAPRGLRPGTSVRPDVEKAFGQPVREVSKTLVEYGSGKQGDRIFAQYRPDSILERLEVVYSAPMERSQIVRELGLPDRPSASKTSDAGRVEEYFSSQLVVLTYSAMGVSGGVSRVGHYSRELFEAAAPPTSVANPKPTSTGTPPGSISPPDTPPPSTPPPNRDGAIRVDDERALQDFVRTVAPPGSTIIFTTPDGRVVKTGSQDSSSDQRPAGGSGMITWDGEAKKNQIVVIDGNRASVGTLDGALPGIPVRITADMPPDLVTIIEQPSARNGWKRLTFRLNFDGGFTFSLQWKAL